MEAHTIVAGERGSGDRLDKLDRGGRELLDAPDAWRALSEWLCLFDQSATEYGGMSARLSGCLADDGSPVATLCGPMKANFAHLFERAKNETPLRPDVTAVPLLEMISGLPKDPQSGETPHPCLDIVLCGLPASQRHYRDACLPRDATVPAGSGVALASMGLQHT